MKKARVSQLQIARDLGVSQTLVSMVLNGRQAGISEESYQNIWNHARRVGYRPKGMDPDVGGEQTAQTVGFVLRAGLTLHSQSNFFSHVQHGLHEFLSARGLALTFLGSEERLDARQLKTAYSGANRLRGLVVMGEVKESFLHALRTLEPRVVSVSAQYSGLCHSVLSNEQQTGEQIVEHLTGLGHRSFAWINGSRGMQRARQRHQAVLNALHLRDLPLDPRFSLEFDGADRLEGHEAAHRLLTAAGKRHRPTAWICFNGLMARGAANGLLQNGVRIPQDVSLAAFDHTRICMEERPALSAGGAEPESMGRIAGELVLQSTGRADEAFSDTVLASEFTARESTGTPPAAGEPAARAGREGRSGRA